MGMARNWFGPLVAILLLFSMACGGAGTSSTGAGGGTGGGGGSGGGGGGTPTPSSTFKHVVVVIFENQDYADVIGSAAMPYLNQLAQQHSLASQFYANVHPSIGNYFMLTSGVVVSTADSFAGTFSGDNVASLLSAAGKDWKVYAQSLPSAGYVDGDQYPYIEHHNPFAYYDSVRNDPAQKSKIVPLENLAADASANTLPAYAFVVPDNLHNGHDCPGGGSACPSPAAWVRSMPRCRQASLPCLPIPSSSRTAWWWSLLTNPRPTTPWVEAESR